MNETERFAQSRQGLRRAATRPISPTNGHEKSDIGDAVIRQLEPAKTGAANGAQNLRSEPTNIEDQIRVRAYERYLERQGRPGSPEADWVEAEREVRSASWSTRQSARTPGSLST
jgi:hypothetical protein